MDAKILFLGIFLDLILEIHPSRVACSASLLLAREAPTTWYYTPEEPIFTSNTKILRGHRDNTRWRLKPSYLSTCSLSFLPYHTNTINTTKISVRTGNVHNGNAPTFFFSG